MKPLAHRSIAAVAISTLLGCAAGSAQAPIAQPLPVLDVVVGNNFGHLPMFVGVKKGFFRKYGVEVRLNVVNTGTDMVNAMQRREVQVGDMSVSTFLKARHAGEPFRVIGLIQNDATRSNADVTIVNIMAPPVLAPTIQGDPRILRSFVAGLAAASQYTRRNRDEAVEIFAKRVPGLDLAVGKKAVRHISYDPRISRPVMQAFEAAEDDVLKNTLKDAPRLDIPEQFAASFLAEAQKAYPEYFSDLPPLPAGSR